MENCPLCDTLGVRLPQPTSRMAELNCVACGPFRMTFPSPLSSIRSSWSKTQRLRVALWVLEQNRIGAPPTVTSEVMADVASLPAPTMSTRLDSYLRTAAELADFEVGKYFEAYAPRMQVACFCSSENELGSIVAYWQRQGAISSSTGLMGHCYLTADGFLTYEERHRAAGKSSQAFVAMWFDPTVQSAFEKGIAAAVRSAGYEPLRVDQIHHEGRIDDRIIAEIRRSKFVVADFTGHRGGVYYEAGFAHGLGLPVIFCCRQDALNDLHFDVRQYNTIDWKDPDDLRVRLHNRLLALFGAGPAAPNAAAIP
jgi:hypothetical protein